ncbi:hypothetical protein [Candidatus Hydrogenosomobacter endosymbioticus]|uniref:Lipoprotein n=1 Tax=Candidatus Hydrogenosomobacter endosymbioticus TaxID=2558174 RepID=A0ABN6L2P5_9PROT|nr:hypothetical protein [Candidatus Hydrogenosomobacter endosymbioticus]BDB96154.1 hypothetical protein HYD_2870 [Candidatus Hydrogenosomobacter endosymbioticus]
MKKISATLLALILASNCSASKFLDMFGKKNKKQPTELTYQQQKQEEEEKQLSPKQNQLKKRGDALNQIADHSKQQIALSEQLLERTRLFREQQLAQQEQERQEQVQNASFTVFCKDGKASYIVPKKWHKIDVIGLGGHPSHPGMLNAISACVMHGGIDINNVIDNKNNIPVASEKIKKILAESANYKKKGEIQNYLSQACIMAAAEGNIKDKSSFMSKTKTYKCSGSGASLKAGECNACGEYFYGTLQQFPSRVSHAFDGYNSQ